MKKYIEGDITDMAVAAVKMPKDKSSMGLRPYLSLIDPHRADPMPRPSMTDDRPSWVTDGVV